MFVHFDSTPNSFKFLILQENSEFVFAQVHLANYKRKNGREQFIFYTLHRFRNRSQQA